VQHLLITGFDSLHTPKSTALAFDLAQRYISAVYLAFQRTLHQNGTGVMLEKYDCSVLGGGGGGGEYELQTGFGWTNGVALALLQRYGDRLVAPNVTASP
jgi:alpha,alpha-trehalase